MAATARTIERLRWHAGLITDDPAAAGSPVDELLFECEASRTEFEAAVRDLLGTLQSLNLELNGARPSEFSESKRYEVPRTAAYAISEVTMRLRSRNAADAAWRVELAWNAVLAGDIDDVMEHVQQEADAAP